MATNKAAGISASRILQVPSGLISVASVNDLQSELEDSWLKGARNLSATGWTAGNRRHWNGAAGRGSCRCGALRSADVARQIKVRMVEQVVDLGPELHLQILNRCVELLVDIEIGFIKHRRPARVARPRPERTQH